jgi:hypothetical protein
MACSTKFFKCENSIHLRIVPAWRNSSSPSWDEAGVKLSPSRGRCVAPTGGDAAALRSFRRSNIMSDNNNKTQTPAEFDFSAYPANTLFHDRRTGGDRRVSPGNAESTTSQSDSTGPPRPEKRVRKERRRRIDPTTFEKQYTGDEMEFMNAMQRFKERTGKAFPTHGEVIKVAVALGYRKRLDDEVLATGSTETPFPRRYEPD